MLRIEHYSKTYPGGKKAVDDLSLHVRPGEIYGFIGHNGAGKTTPLRAVAGVMDFTEGTITIDGHDVKKDPVGAKRVTAFLPDNPDLYDLPADQRTADIGKYGDAFELTGNLGSPIGSYSHGMRQKLALISAFIRRPRLLILDEPFVGLDPAASHLMKGYLADLCRGGSAVFFSTHVLEVAEKLCHQIAIIKDGRLVKAGPTGELVGDSSLEDVFLELEGEK